MEKIDNWAADDQLRFFENICTILGDWGDPSATKTMFENQSYLRPDVKKACYIFTGLLGLLYKDNIELFKILMSLSML